MSDPADGRRQLNMALRHQRAASAGRRGANAGRRPLHMTPHDERAPVGRRGPTAGGRAEPADGS